LAFDPLTFLLPKSHGSIFATVKVFPDFGGGLDLLAVVTAELMVFSLAPTKSKKSVRQ
jgi:hypothetical protein